MPSSKTFEQDRARLARHHRRCDNLSEGRDEALRLTARTNELHSFDDSFAAGTDVHRCVHRYCL